MRFRQSRSSLKIHGPMTSPTVSRPYVVVRSGFSPRGLAISTHAPAIRSYTQASDSRRLFCPFANADPSEFVTDAAFACVRSYLRVNPEALSPAAARNAASDPHAAAEMSNESLVMVPDVALGTGSPGAYASFANAR